MSVRPTGDSRGFLPRAAAASYSPALAELADDDRHLTVPARVWAAALGTNTHSEQCLAVHASGFWRSSIHGFPRGALSGPTRRKGTIHVAGEDQHMDWLGRYIADQPRYLAVSCTWSRPGRTAL